MATVNTNDLRIKNAKNFIDSLNGPSVTPEAQAYMFIGRPTPWADDNAPPVPRNNFKEFYNTYDEMLSLKRINDIDALHMIPRIRWTSGVTYDMYKDNYSIFNRSVNNQSNLYDCVYYVINASHVVYVCLFNNNNQASTVEPQDVGTEPFFTSDGYQWLKLYTVPNDDIATRSTENFIPIVENDVTDGTPGAIYTVVIDNPGNDYTNNPAGGPNQLPYYYCNIVGDGVGAVARVKVTLGRIAEVSVVRNGAGYTEASLQFEANKIYSSLSNLDAGISALNPLGDGTLRTTVVISPPGGWGTDLPRELGGTRVGVFSTLTDTDFDFTEGVSFRQIGIIQDPEFAPNTPENPDTMSATFAIYYNEVSGTQFSIGETIEQTVDIGSSVKVAKGTVVDVDTDNNIVKYFQDPFIHSDDDGSLYRFRTLASQSTGQVLIVGVESNTVVTPEDYTGTKADLYFIAGYADPEIIQYSGLMTYLTNQPPITRADNQSEKITLIVGY